MSEFNLHDIKGLSPEQAAQRLQVEGFNELPASRRRGIFTIAWEVIREPMLLLLVGCGAVYVFIGDREEAAMLLGFVGVVISITLYQQRKTERALEALRDLTSPRANVIRGGEKLRIPGREVVREDMLLLAEGDRIPADGVLLSATSLCVDESLLTGESAAVRKVAQPPPAVAESGATPAVCAGVPAEDTAANAAAVAPCRTVTAEARLKQAGKPVPPSPNEPAMSRPGGEDLPFVFAGSLVVRGQGVARVLATGMRSEMGKIGKALQGLETEQTLLQHETNRLVHKLAIIGLGMSALVAVGYALTHPLDVANRTKTITEGLLAGITLAMAVLPEEFPMVLTIFLALGAWRMSRKRVLTRRVPAVEMLGAATVLCVDKTGTLTYNRMTVVKVFAHGLYLDITATARSLPEAFHELVEFAVLASKRDPFDPMEKALNHVGARTLSDTEHLHASWSLVREYPLGSELLALSHVWKSPDGQDFVVAAKGAPEAIADLCHLPAEQASAMQARVAEMAGEGLRILGVAKASFNQANLPGGQHDFHFNFIGLVGLVDPVRETVKPAIAECYTAGIRVVMITGDYAGTAQHVARQIGLKEPELVITGPELEAMSEPELRRRIGQVNVFSRVVPEQKLLLVKALKANGEVVAMTGDGVNDAPALKAAHIGIAMGGRGTDVAREASALVLLDDDFSSIVAAVRMGRRIFDNIRKAVAYIFAIHVPIAGMSLIPVLMGWPLVLLPVHIVFLELIIDPACSVVFEGEPEEADIMTRRPRRRDQRLFDRWTIGLSILQGLSVLAFVLGVFVIGRAVHPGAGEQEWRALAFCTLIVANLALILTNRSWSQRILTILKTPNKALWWVVGGALTLLAAVLYLPGLRGMFRFEKLHGLDLLVCLGSGVASVVWFEAAKGWLSKRRRAERIAEVSQRRRDAKT